MPTKRYSHIFWDWNGTLLNDVDWCIARINHMLKKGTKSPYLTYLNITQHFVFLSLIILIIQKGQNGNSLFHSGPYIFIK